MREIAVATAATSMGEMVSPSAWSQPGGMEYSAALIGFVKSIAAGSKMIPAISNTAAECFGKSTAASNAAQ